MNLKRIGTLLLAAAMSASFMAGCGDQPAQSSGSQPESSKPESSAAQSETSGFSYPTTGSLTFWQWANGNVGANFASFEDTPAAGGGVLLARKALRRRRGTAGLCGRWCSRCRIPRPKSAG